MSSKSWPYKGGIRKPRGSQSKIFCGLWMPNLFDHVEHVADRILDEVKETITYGETDDVSHESQQGDEPSIE